MVIFPNLTYEEYTRRVETIDECVRETVNCICQNTFDEETKAQMFNYIKAIGLKVYKDSYLNYLNSFK